MSQDMATFEDGLASLGGDEDTYVIEPASLLADAVVIVSDQGPNTVQLAGGFEIAGSRLTSDDLELTFVSGARLIVLNAADFTYVTGEAPGISWSFSGFAEGVLATSLPPEGSVVAGSGARVEADGSVAFGTEGPDSIAAGPADDAIDGLAGDDTIDGGAGDDTIDGGAGADVLSGGAGADLFAYTAASGSSIASGVDTIVDFEPGADRISVDLDGVGLLVQAGQSFVDSRGQTGVLVEGDALDGNLLTVAGDDATTQVILDTNANGVLDAGDLLIALDGALVDSLSEASFTGLDIEVNTAPGAADDTAETGQDVPVTIDVLANDSDPDGDALTVTGASAGSGTVAINGDGTLTYTPAAGFAGTDTISYTISDGRGGTDTATVGVTVTAVEQATLIVTGLNGATAEADRFLVDLTDVSGGLTARLQGFDPAEDLLLIQGLADAVATSLAELNGDTGLAGDPVVVQTNPFEGSLVVNFGRDPDGEVVSLVIEGLTTASQVPVEIVDGVTGGTNRAPVAVDDTALTGQDTAVVIPVLANDSDPDGDALTVTSAAAGSGSVTINGDGTLSYTPAAGFTGSDTISYAISDGNGGSDSATVGVTVTSGSGPNPITAIDGATVAATAAADAITVDVSDGGTFSVTGFDPAEDVFLLEGLPSATGTTLAEINGDTGIGGDPIVVQVNPFTGSLLVNFGRDSAGDAASLAIAGITDASLVDIDLA